MNGLYVQFGCGFCAPNGWLNFDASPTLRFERILIVGKLYSKNASRFPENVRYGDIVSGLPIEHESCEGIYCSHILEHLSLTDADLALQNVYGYLMTGGTFRVVVPDLDCLARTYIQNSSETAAHQFMQDSYLGRKQRPRGLAGFIKDWLGNSNHMWMWDRKSLTAKLKQHGFRDIRPASFGDSENPKFIDVEDKGRFEGAVAVQCRK